LGVSQEEIEQTIIHDGIDRDFMLYIPSGYDPSADQFPIVFNFHGFTSNAAQQKQYSRMDAIAEANNFIVCYPEGIENAWNVGWDFGSNEDDIGFTQAMISTIAMDYNIDRQRIYACGMSNGGFFSYRLACELSNTFAAVASVTGSFTDEMLANCSPTRNVPVMEVHGTDDLIVPYNGLAGTAIPIEDVIDFWVTENICTMTPDTTAIPNTNNFDGCTSEMIEYLNCEDESEVVFVKITGGGHTWPGGAFPLPGTSRDYDGSQLVWDFFNRHRLPAVLSNDEVNTSTLSIFPNPVKDYFQIKGNEELEKILLYDINGKLVQTSQKELVNISMLNSGLYMAMILTDKQTSLIRIIKH